MENRQTAVEWLEQKVFEEFKVPINYQVYEQAKQMEKEHHIETWKRGSYSLLEHGSGEDFEQYYNETYGK